MLQQLVNGVAIGSTYGLLAIGLTLIFFVMRMVQVAHGEVFMVGAYFGLYAITATSGNVLAGLAFAFATTAVLGIVIERLLFRPFLGRARDDYPVIVITIALALLLSEVMRLTVNNGVAVEYPHQVWLGGAVRFGGVRVGTAELAAFAILLVALIAYEYVMRRTKLGLGVRAMASSFTMARLLGVKVNAIAIGTVGAASGLAAVVGVLMGIRVGAVSPSIGVTFGLKALAIALFAGLGNVWGAAVGALLLGIAESFIVAHTSGSYQDALAFGMIILILVLRPRGMFGAPAEVATQE